MGRSPRYRRLIYATNDARSHPRGARARPDQRRLPEIRWWWWWRRRRLPRHTTARHELTALLGQVADLVGSAAGDQRGQRGDGDHQADEDVDQDARPGRQGARAGAGRLGARSRGARALTAGGPGGRPAGGPPAAP